MSGPRRFRAATSAA